MPSNKLRLYFWLISAFFEKYLLHVTISFFLTILLFVGYLYFSKDIIQILSTNTSVIGISGKYTLDALPDEIIRKVTVPLLVQKPDGSFESQLVSKYSHNKQFTQFQIELYPDATFSDGTPFTSRDIEFGFRDVQTAYPSNTSLLYSLKKPFPPFLSYLTQPVYTTNPFRGIKGDYMITQAKYAANNDRLSELTLTPLIEGKPKLIYRFYRSDLDLVTAYKLREINEFSTNGKVAYDTFTKWPKTAVEKSSDVRRVLTLFFNLEHPLLKEKDFRLALYGSIPLKLLTEAGDIAVSPISPISPNYDADIARIAENPEVSKNILKRFLSQASESASFKLSTSFEFINVAHAIEEIIESAGGKVTVDISGLRPGERSELTLGLWNIPSDVNQYFLWHSSQKTKSNITSYDNKKVDKLLEDFRATDSATMQKKIMTDFQKKIVEDAPAIFLYYPHIFTIRRT